MGWFDRNIVIVVGLSPGVSCYELHVLHFSAHSGLGRLKVQGLVGKEGSLVEVWAKSVGN